MSKYTGTEQVETFEPIQREKVQVGDYYSMSESTQKNDYLPPISELALKQWDSGVLEVRYPHHLNCLSDAQLRDFMKQLSTLRVIFFQELAKRGSLEKKDSISLDKLK